MNFPQGFNGNNLTWEQAIGCFWDCGQGDQVSHRSFSGAYSRFAQSVGTVAQAKAWMSAFDTIRPPARAEQSACAAAVSKQAEGGWADVLVDSLGGAVNQVLDRY